MNMGKGKLFKKPKSVDTEAIRKEEEGRIKRENLNSIKMQEEQRRKARAGQSIEDEDEISRKRLLGL